LEKTCQRCHETLREADRYCPSCGLPQLIYLAAETPAAPLAETDASTTFPAIANSIAWRPAIQAAVLLAIPAGLLSYTLTPFLTLFWVMGAAAWAVHLYARRARLGALSMGAGARIGLVTGLLAAWLSFGANGVALWIARFLRHQGGQIDSEWVAAAQQSYERSQQMVAQASLTSAQAAQMLQLAQWFRALELSPEGRAGFALGGLLTLALVLMIVATLGGVVGARLLVSPRRPGA
jgi:hypothetical protein